MGLYFRKSVRMGPFRVNFSTSGIGLSAGIPGFRVGTGPRGNYIQMGAHGIYYRAALSSRDRSTSSRIRATPSTARPDIENGNPPIPDRTLGAYQPIESVAAQRLVDSSSEDLLNEIRKRHRQWRSWPFVTAAASAALAVSGIQSYPQWLLIAIVILGVVGIGYAYRRDVGRKLVILQYDMDAESQAVFTALLDSAREVAASNRLWHISASAPVRDRKYHAGASSTVNRKAAELSSVPPPYVASNVDPVTLVLSKATFYFFPDRLLVYSGHDVGAVSYANLHATAAVTRFIEEQGVPGDSVVVDRTWRFVNKKGGPDRRFKSNRELPICEYGEVARQSEAGINELLMISRRGPEIPFASAINRLAAGRPLPHDASKRARTKA